MLTARPLASLLLLFALPLLSGCVGPNAHGPLGGCCGPIAFGDADACAGCGELYVDPWVNHPADCVDPCDSCGNFNGQSCGSCRPIFEGFHSLWGYKCGNDCGCGIEPTCGVSTGGLLGGCGCGVESCDGGCDVSCGVEACGASCGCESCGIGGDVYLSENATGGEYLGEGEHIVSGVPTPIESYSNTDLTNRPYKPERQRKIFNPRPRVATGQGRQLGY